MGIRVAHEISGSLAGDIAYKTGQGIGRERRVLADREASQRATELAAANARYFAGLQAQSDQQENAQAFALEKTALDRKASMDQVELEYSMQQRREMDQLEQAESWVRNQFASGQWTEDEATEAIEQIRTKAYAITPRRKWQKSPQEEFKKNIIVDDDGTKYYKTNSGDYKPLNDVPTYREIMQVKTAKGNMIAKLLGVTQQDTATGIAKPLYTLAEARKLADDIFALNSDMAGMDGMDAAGTTDGQAAAPAKPIPSETFRASMEKSLGVSLKGTEEAWKKRDEILTKQDKASYSDVLDTYAALAVQILRAQGVEVNSQSEDAAMGLLKHLAQLDGWQITED